MKLVSHVFAIFEMLKTSISRKFLIATVPFLLISSEIAANPLLWLERCMGAAVDAPRVETAKRDCFETIIHYCEFDEASQSCHNMLLSDMNARSQDLLAIVSTAVETRNDLLTAIYARHLEKVKSGEKRQQCQPELSDAACDSISAVVRLSHLQAILDHLARTEAQE